MDRQLLRLSRLVEDLLDLTRIGQGKLAVAREPLDLNPLLLESTEAVRPLAEARDIELVVEAACAGAFVAGDRYRLLQVFTNLLDNAIKFTPIGGKIMAILDVEEPEAVVRVRDTGVGFRAEDAERIFELFAQAHPALDQTRLGLGLGLAIVRDLVAIHGGTVQAQSAGEEKGSEFIVRLPLITSLAQH
jgi:signal transduction histidine kinase